MSTPRKHRVAAYVEEPHALAVRRGDLPQQEVIGEALPFLQAEGWTDLKFERAYWDDHPQFSGKAFYIEFRGVRADGLEPYLVEFDAVACVLFQPE